MTQAISLEYIRATDDGMYIISTPVIMFTSCVIHCMAYVLFG